MIVTADLLVSAMGASRDRAELFAPHLAEACAAYEIATPARLAAFIAQIGHESGSLRHVREVWGPTTAQERYEGRADLGNTQPGDGRKFSGHGLIQTTGRFNHRAVRDRLRARGMDCPDFEAAPDLLAEPRWAAWSAADYWDWKGCNALADSGSFEAITLKINGGLNGQADRMARWERAKAALAAAPASATTPPPQAAPAREPWQSDDPGQYSQEAGMPLPIPAIVAALLPSVIEAVPKLGALFKGGGSEVAQRNMAAATTVLDIVQKATNTPNAQAAVEAMQADPVARTAAAKAIEDNWYQLTEAGGGGIEGARKADVAMVSMEGPWWTFLRSPSFWMLLLSLPLVYIVVGSISGLWGHADWSSDVRASLATAVVSLIVGGAAGYFWGQTTSRNRAPAP